MGCPEGMSKIHYTRLALEIWFVTVYFSGIKAVIITSKHCTTIFFPFTIFFLENFGKARVNAPWASHNTP